MSDTEKSVEPCVRPTVALGWMLETSERALTASCSMSRK